MTTLGWRKYGAATYTIDDPRVEPVPETGCWLWVGHVNAHGYGLAGVRVAGRSVSRRAHRLVWENLVGQIPDGLFIDHTCRVRSCVNPDHLRIVTKRQNSLENSLGVTAIQAAKTCCPKCGGPYTQARADSRRCAPCRKAGRRKRYGESVLRGQG